MAVRNIDANSVKALDRNRQALKKEKCLSWVISIRRKAMAQSKNEICTVLSFMTECLDGNWIEMIVASQCSSIFPVRWAPASAAAAVEDSSSGKSC